LGSVRRARCAAGPASADGILSLLQSCLTAQECKQRRRSAIIIFFIIGDRSVYLATFIYWWIIVIWLSTPNFNKYTRVGRTEWRRAVVSHSRCWAGILCEQSDFWRPKFNPDAQGQAQRRTVG
jgi:hypothetical protein